MTTTRRETQLLSTLLGHPVAELQARGATNTAREIAQQPDVWRSVAAAAAASRRGDEAFLGSLLARRDLRVVLAGAGSSAYAGQVLAPALAQAWRRRVDAVATTDIVSSPRQYLAEDVPTLLVSFGRSGDSPESIAAIELVEQQLGECWHLVVTCNADGRLAREHQDRSRSQLLLLPSAANDRGFAMTSSFTGMMLAAMLALGAVQGEGVVDRIAAAGERVLRARTGDAQALAARQPRRLVYLGSGSLRGVAAESALKALELTAGGVVALGESAVGFRHGPKAVIDERTVVVVYLSNDAHTRKYDLDILEELREAVPPENLIAVCGAGDPPRGVTVWTLPGLEDLADAVLALPAVICAQMIGLELSLATGCTPDNPFPAGQVNRVVQGVRIHPLRS